MNQMQYPLHIFIKKRTANLNDAQLGHYLRYVILYLDIRSESVSSV